MKQNLKLLLVFSAIGFVFLLEATKVCGQNDDPLGRDFLFKEVDEIMRQHEYKATEHIVTTHDGYRISLIRCTNPLINNGRKGLDEKEVVVIIHGTLANNNYIVVKSVNARPKDYRETDPSKMSVDELDKFLANDPARGNLCMLMLQFGHECWFVNKRGSPRSRTRVNGHNPGLEKTKGSISGLKSIVEHSFKELSSPGAQPMAIFNSLTTQLYEQITKIANGDFWEYSLDEQAEYDVPQSIEYILKVTKRKTLAVIGHSTGGAITAMALANEPSIAAKISQAHLVAPAVELGNSAFESLKDGLTLILGSYIGPFPPLIAEPILEGATGALCSNTAIDLTACKALNDAFSGTSGPNVRYTPGYLSGTLKSVAARELVHLVQPIVSGTTRKYDFNNVEENRARYNRDTPPEYDFGRIPELNVTLYGGYDDGLVNVNDVASLARKMSQVNPEVKFLLEGDKWNHVSWFLHDRNHYLFNIPVLRKLSAIQVQ